TQRHYRPATRRAHGGGMTRPAVSKKPAKSPKLKLPETALIRRLSSPRRFSEGGAEGGLPLAPPQPPARVSGWLVSIATSAAGKALGNLLRETPLLSQVIGSIA